MKVLLKNVRLAFPKLWDAEQFEDGGKPRYSATFLVEPGSENDKAIRKAIKEEAEGKWGPKAAGVIKAIEGHNGKFCYQDGITKSDKYDGFEGNWYLAAHRNEDQGAPAVVDKDKSPLARNAGKPYAGCFVNASVEIWAQTGTYQGVRCTLKAIQFVADGEAFAGAPANADDFDDLSSGDNDDFGDLVA